MYYAACCCGPYTPNCDCEGYGYAKASCRVSMYQTPPNQGAISSSTQCDELCRTDQGRSDTAILIYYAECTTFMKCTGNANERTEFRSSALPDFRKTFDPDNFKSYWFQDVQSLRTFNHLDRGCHPSPGVCTDDNCAELLHNCCNYGSAGNIIEAAGRWLYYERKLEQAVVNDGHDLLAEGGSFGNCSSEDRPRADSRTFVGRSDEMPVPTAVRQQLDPNRFYRYINVFMRFCAPDARRVEEIDALSGPVDPFYDSSTETLSYTYPVSCWQINDIGDACDGAAVGTPVITSDWNSELYVHDSGEEHCPEEEYGPNCCGEGTIPASSSTNSATLITTATDVVFDLEFMDEPPDPW